MENKVADNTIMLIPKTFKTKPVIKNHITVESGTGFGIGVMATFVAGLQIVHPIFTIPFIGVNLAILWFAIFPSKWDENKTKIEVYFSYLRVNKKSFIKIKRGGLEHVQQVKKTEERRDKRRKRIY